MSSFNRKISEETLNITRHFDHTCLRPDMNTEDLYNLCINAIQYECASICIPPYLARLGKKIIDDLADKYNKPKICTVIGFPLGYNSPASKLTEIREVAPYVDEIDIVLNQILVKSGELSYAFKEISVLRTYAKTLGIKTVKVIVETCNLTEKEKFDACLFCIDTKVDYIKTSTGFGKAGAQIEDIKMFRTLIDFTKSNLKIKASGGIKTLEQAKDFINAGADRIGESSAI